MHRKLKIKLLFIQLLSILPFLLFIFYIYDLWYDTRRSQVLDQNINEAKIVAASFRDSINNGLNLTTVFSEDLAFTKLISGDKETSNLTLGNILKNFPEFDSIQTTDDKGKIQTTTVILTPEQEKIGISDRPYFQELLQTKKKVISNPIIGKFTNKNLVVVASPILKNNEVAGMVGVSIDLGKLKSKIENILTSDHGKNITILDRDGQIVFITNKPLPGIDEKSLLASFPFVKEAQTGKVALIENQQIPPSDKTYIGAAVPLDNFGWVVISAEPMENVFAPLLKIQSVIWLIIIVALLFSVSLITFFLRKVRVIY